MSTIDYAVDIGLIAIIFLQVRPHELTPRSARLALIAIIIVACAPTCGPSPSPTTTLYSSRYS
jgi:hypothetical protein